MNIYEALLGSSFQDLPEGVRLAHRVPLMATGLVTLERGRGPIARLIGNAAGFPHAGRGIPLVLRVFEREGVVVWERGFGDEVLTTVQWIGDGLLFERSRSGVLAFRLEVVGESVTYESCGFRLLGVPLPRFLGPRAVASVSATLNGWEVVVEVSAPLVGLVCRYSATMKADERSDLASRGAGLLGSV